MNPIVIISPNEALLKLHLPVSGKSKLGLGTVQFGLDYGISNEQGKTPFQEVIDILSFSNAHHIKVLDTASAYGESESVLGRSGVKQFDIITKFLAKSADECTSQMASSLAKLNCDHVYGFLSHNISQLIDNPSIWSAMLELKEQGKTKKIGFSFNSLSEIEDVMKAGWIPDLIQIPFNILDYRFMDIAKYFKAKGTEIHSRSAFLQGLFFCQPQNLSDHFKDVKPFLQELQNYSTNLAGDLLKYCTDNPVIDKVIVGVNNLPQLKEIIVGLENAVKLELECPKLGESILAPYNWRS